MKRTLRYSDSGCRMSVKKFCPSMFRHTVCLHKQERLLRGTECYVDARKGTSLFAVISCLITMSMWGRFKAKKVRILDIINSVVHKYTSDRVAEQRGYPFVWSSGRRTKLDLPRASHRGVSTSCSVPDVAAFGSIHDLEDFDIVKPEQTRF